VLAETFEAVIGAIYLDGGFGASKRTIEKLFEI
jgi:dsRNA-specific ribonuclease